MNLVLWIVQVLLALHTTMGALWKTSNSAQTVPSLAAIPHGVWLALVGVELLCAVGLVAPAVSRRWASLAPIAAVCIAVEMLIFTALNLTSGVHDPGSVIYWLVVAAVCAFVAYGRLVLTSSHR